MPYGLSPFLACLVNRKIHDLVDRVIIRECRAVLRHLPERIVKALDGIRGVDDTADLIRVLEELVEVVPVALPGSAYHRVLGIPNLPEIIKRQQRLFLRGGAVDSLQVTADCL